MKKIPIFVAALIPLLASAAGETEKIPSLVVGHYYGVDSYPVHLSDYSRIELSDDHYTLKAKSGDTSQDIPLSYAQYPRFWVEDMAQDIPTSLGKTNAPENTSVVVYNMDNQLLYSTTGVSLSLRLFNLKGKMVLSGDISADRQLSVATLAAGVYIVSVEGVASAQNLKFTKH